MSTPFSQLIGLPYAQDEVNAIIANYPHINTHAANMSSGSPHPQAVAVTDEMFYQEFEPIFKKILDCVKEDMKGSEEVKSKTDSLGNFYPNGIDYLHAKNCHIESHGGWPGCQHLWETSLAGRLCKQISSVANLSRLAESYVKQKEERERLYVQHLPTLKQSVEYGMCERGRKPGNGETIRFAGNNWFLFRFNNTLLTNLKRGMKEDTFNYIIGRAILECEEKIYDKCAREDERYTIDSEVDRRIVKAKQEAAKLRFERKVAAEMARRLASASAAQPQAQPQPQPQPHIRRQQLSVPHPQPEDPTEPDPQV